MGVHMLNNKRHRITAVLYDHMMPTLHDTLNWMLVALPLKLCWHTTPYVAYPQHFPWLCTSHLRWVTFHSQLHLEDCKDMIVPCTRTAHFYPCSFPVMAPQDISWTLTLTVINTKDFALCASLLTLHTRHFRVLHLSGSIQMLHFIHWNK